MYGIARRKSDMTLGNLESEPELKKQIYIFWGDITDSLFVQNVVKQVKPDELYHLASQSFVALSFENPSFTYDVNIKGTLHILNVLKDSSKGTRMYNAATSELFGKPSTAPQNEKTPFIPKSPYAIAKLAAYWTAVDYREAYDIFVANGILFNHESEVRGPEFVTRKITLGVARIYHGSNEPITLGNLARKDWDYAKDYVKACS
ncbi:MAG: GDP-mannose 4,6-dehydratase [Candidatus Micrarchaeaceae archaeon]